MDEEIGAKCTEIANLLEQISACASQMTTLRGNGAADEQIIQNFMSRETRRSLAAIIYQAKEYEAAVIQRIAVMLKQL